MLTAHLRELVRQTTDHACRWNDDDAHTVAAGLLTESGRVILGLNAHHFLGGACGEVAALSHHAATAPEDPIRAVAAVYGPTGDVIAPCGKCRQILFDIDPSIRFVMREAAGLTTRTARELLPSAFDQTVLEAPQRIHMWEGYEPLIRSGAKRQTLRVDDPFRPGPATLVFEKADGQVVDMPAEVTAVRSLSSGELTEDDAVRDGFTTLAELRTALDRHYPGLDAESPVDVVTFELTAQGGVRAVGERTEDAQAVG